jgi:hypothetical protein
VPIAGGPTTVLVPNMSADAITVDGTSVYWVSILSATVSKAPLAGGTPTVLATGQMSLASVVAVDGQAVYWIANGQVLKAAK